MGKIKYINEVRQFFRKSPVVSLASIKKIIIKHRGSESCAYILINHLLKRREIKKITKGFYTIHDDPDLAVFCFKPAYLGLQDALSIHNLWEQETNPVIITTRVVRQGVREIFNNNVIMKRIQPKYFFGIDYMKYGDFCIPVSDIEKTLFDLIYFKQKLDKKLIKEFKKRSDMNKIKTYAKRYPAKVGERVLGLLRS